MRWTRPLSWFALLLLTGCANNFPVPDETEGGYLAFPMEIIDETKTPFHFVYSFKVFDRETNEEVDTFVMNPANGTYVRSFGPMPTGNYYLGEKTTYAKQSANVRLQFKPNPRTVYFPFTIHEDTISVLNQQLWVYKRFQEDGRGNTTSTQVVGLTSETRDNALEQLAQQDESGRWIIEIGE